MAGATKKPRIKRANVIFIVTSRTGEHMNAAYPDHSHVSLAPAFRFRFWHNAPMPAKTSAQKSDKYPMVNRQFSLAARPVGMPKKSDFQLVESPVPQLSEGEVLLRTLFLSVDPYMRSRMNGIKTYADPVNIGQVMVGGTIGQVVDSTNPKFQPGDVCEAYGGWQEYSISGGEKLLQARPALCSHFHRARRPGNAGNDGLFRASRYLQAAAG